MYGNSIERAGARSYGPTASRDRAESYGYYTTREIFQLWTESFSVANDR